MNELDRGELDPVSFVEWHQRILAHDEQASRYVARSYPGYPRWSLPRLRWRWWPALDRVLVSRRSHRTLTEEALSRKTLGRLLWLSHGSHLPDQRGAVPSAGGLQGLELYLINLVDGWLPGGLYHYDRPGHHLSQIRAGAARSEWHECVPSLGQVEGGALLWVCVGDSERVRSKYGERGERFLLLEAGHLMQNLCLVSVSLRLATVPLGGFFERDIADRFALPSGDLVLYMGLSGRPV